MFITKLLHGKYNKLETYYKEADGEYETAINDVENTFTNYYTLTYKKATEYKENTKYYLYTSEWQDKTADVDKDSFSIYYVLNSEGKYVKATSYNKSQAYYIYISERKL